VDQNSGYDDFSYFPHFYTNKHNECIDHKDFSLRHSSLCLSFSLKSIQSQHSRQNTS
ncbi:14407_t:CDS:1, partial [Entrophospora sp. SA101]